MKNLMLLGFIALMMSPLTTHAQRGMYIPLSKPNKEVHVRISFQKGSLQILAWDKAAVEYKAEGGGWITNAEDKNEVLIKVAGDDSISMIVYVPRHCHLTVKSFQEGPIDIKDVEGTLVVDAYNGSVGLREVAGNAIVSAWNGAIFASFKTVNDKPMAFTTYDGEIKLLLPHDTNAKILASYQNGSLTTDFAQANDNANAVGTNTESRWDQLILGNGQPEWRVRNLNGDVQILKW